MNCTNLYAYHRLQTYPELSKTINQRQEHQYWFNLKEICIILMFTYLTICTINNVSSTKSNYILTNLFPPRPISSPVVICYLFASINVPQSKEKEVRLALCCDLLYLAVWMVVVIID